MEVPINKSIFILAIANIVPLVVMADDTAPNDVIIVTATRNEISLEDATIPVTIIDREQIELSLATDLSELLRFEAGIDIGRNGGPGQATSVFIRGTESNHTLLLIDGVRVNPGTIGGAAFQHIAPEIIERVEIVKGARSALYGTDAIGGVINVITRQADRPNFDVSLGYGSFNTKSGNVSGGIANEDSAIGATLNWQDTDGYKIRTDSDITRGYNNLTANLFARKAFSFGELGIRHWQTDGTVEYFDFFLTPVDQDFTNQSTALELLNDIGERSRSKLILSYMFDDIQQNQSADFVKSKRVALDWQYTVNLQQHGLAGGIYLTDENASAISFGSGFDEDTATKAIFLQDSIDLGRHRGFLAARFTDHETFGNKLTWNAEYGFDLNDQWSFNAGLGTAFRAPDASDRFGFGGTPDLDAESAEEIQLGAKYQFADRHVLKLEMYANNIDNLIEFDFIDFTLQNIGKAEIRGAEIGYDYQGEDFVFSAHYLRQSAQNADTGERLLRRADESLTVNFAQTFGNYRLGVNVLASGEREDFATTLPGYVLANLTGQVRIGGNMQFNARIENILDTDYETASQYRMQERSAFIELKYHWQ
jgi:vitamin B12 transporter